MSLSCAIHFCYLLLIFCYLPKARERDSCLSTGRELLISYMNSLKPEGRIELPASFLPRKRSATELLRHGCRGEDLPSPFRCNVGTVGQGTYNPLREYGSKPCAPHQMLPRGFEPLTLAGQRSKRCAYSSSATGAFGVG